MYFVHNYIYIYSIFVCVCMCLCVCVYVTLFYVEHFTRYTLNRPRTHVVTLNPSLGGTFTSLAGPKKRVFLCKFSTHLQVNVSLFHLGFVRLCKCVFYIFIFPQKLPVRWSCMSVLVFFCMQFTFIECLNINCIMFFFVCVLGLNVLLFVCT